MIIASARPRLLGGYSPLSRPLLLLVSIQFSDSPCWPNSSSQFQDIRSQPPALPLSQPRRYHGFITCNSPIPSLALQRAVSVLPSIAVLAFPLVTTRQSLLQWLVRFNFWSKYISDLSALSTSQSHQSHLSPCLA
ncbi:hypothetical protein ASPSYDRAFT_45125 [Aspergillus sydowii CBS 593.65]|uniref:Uncharacterized protein n=1 Tax=Aspergillus sydowii CBS 593.65 TaxID=1036612 RepID=A0A1L9TH67_9EURO|nr:uncharacterized protein ASPSYDRAFT_45125 [Aspergillus sydowii CBS 593.65]OJJ58731.1 hypothetical protein ASPSYDRAFT_45125 [Aspergillus sydowii CBS 593.65]